MSNTKTEIILRPLFEDRDLVIPATNGDEPLELLAKTNLSGLIQTIFWDLEFPCHPRIPVRAQQCNAKARLVCAIEGEEVSVQGHEFLSADDNNFFVSMSQVFSFITHHQDLIKELIWVNAGLNERIWPLIPFIDSVQGKSVAYFGKSYSNKDLSFVRYDEFKDWDYRIYTKPADDAKPCIANRYALFIPAGF